jgi:hypothetical protein
MPVVASHRPVTWPRWDVPDGQVGTCSTALVFVLYPHGAGLARGQGGVAAAAGLDRGLLIGADHEVVLAQGFAVAEALLH